MIKKNLIRRTLSFIGLSALVIFISSCSKSSDSSDNSYTLGNLPNSYKVTIPESVEGTDSTSSRGISSDTKDNDGNSMGYRHLQEAMKKAKEQNSKVSALIVLIDAAVDALDKKYTEKKVDSLEIEITSDMIDKINEIGGDKPKFLSDGDVATFTDVWFVGKDKFAETINPEHDKLIAQESALKELYDNMFIFKSVKFGKKKSEDENFKNGKVALITFWNNAKTKLRALTYEKTEVTVEGKTDLETKVRDIIFEDRKSEGLFASVIINWEAPPYIWDPNGDGTGKGKWVLKNSSTAGFKDNDLSQIVINEKDSDKKGILYKFYRKQRRLMGEDTSFDSMKKMEHSLRGYADNNGAYIETTINKEREIMGTDGSLDYGFGGIETRRFDEICGPDGTITGARKYDVSTGGWVPVSDMTFDESNFEYTQYLKYASEKSEAKMDEFTADNGEKDAMNNYVSGKEIPVEIVLSSAIRDYVNSADVKDLKLSLATSSNISGETGAKSVISRAAMPQLSFSDMIKATGQARIKMIIDIRRYESNHPGSTITANTLATTYYVHLQKKGIVLSNGLIQNSSDTISSQVTKTTDGNAILFE